MIYFTSDTHFSHKNIITYANRPFNTAHEMNKEMVARWNSVVQPGDTVFHGGDFAFSSPSVQRSILQTLNGRKILIKGNHDRGAQRMLSFGFDEVLPCYENDHIILLHDPGKFTTTQLMSGKLLLYGHLHDNLYPYKGMINICVEHWHYTPQTLFQLVEGLIK